MMSTSPFPGEVSCGAASLRNQTSSQSALCLPRDVFSERSLRGGKASDRNAERRAGHVIEAGVVTEGHRGRIAAVFAADANLELAPRPPAALDPDLHQFADALAIDGDERIGGEDA